MFTKRLKYLVMVLSSPTQEQQDSRTEFECLHHEKIKLQPDRVANKQIEFSLQK